MLIVILATLLGGVVGVGSVLTRDSFKGRLESPELLEQSGLTVYANLPLSEKGQKLGHGGKRTSDWRKTPGGNNRSGSQPLLANLYPGDATVEALRGLRTTLLVALEVAKNNVLMISGPGTEVGKSFVTANLGVLLAQAGRRVLLIDGDLRKGHLHNYFEVRESQGLSDYLSGKVELDETVHKTGVERVDLIPRGIIPHNPAELLMHPRMQALLDQAAENYDVVLIDTPPVLAVTDAAIIGKLAGVSVLVVRAGVSSIEEVALTCRRFEQNGVGVQGCVFNGMKPGFDSTYGIGASYYG